MRLEVELGRELFAFDSWDRWLNKARGWYATCGYTTGDTVAIDAAGRICVIGRDFARARKESTYPIRVYAIDPASLPDAELQAEGAEHERRRLEVERQLREQIGGAP